MGQCILCALERLQPSFCIEFMRADRSGRMEKTLWWLGGGKRSACRAEAVKAMLEFCYIATWSTLVFRPAFPDRPGTFATPEIRGSAHKFLHAVFWFPVSCLWSSYITPSVRACIRGTASDQIRFWALWGGNLNPIGNGIAQYIYLIIQENLITSCGESNFFKSAFSWDISSLSENL